MPITKSAKKALRQNKRRRERNLRRLNELKKTVKKFKKLITETEKAASEGELRQRREEALKLLPQLYKVIDKSAKSGIIKKNTANRKKSRLTKMLNKNGSHPPKADSETKVSSQTAPAQQ